METQRHSYLSRSHLLKIVMSAQRAVSYSIKSYELGTLEIHRLFLETRPIIDIADETPITEQPDPDGGVTIRIDAAGVQRNKLRVDARKWVAAKLLPRKYGERMLNEVRGNLAVTLEALVCGEDRSDT